MIEREGAWLTAEHYASLPRCFTSGDAPEWFKNFDVSCKGNKWDEAAQALKLPILLEGKGLAIWLEFTEEHQ